jgi:hypothetical protein
MDKRSKLLALAKSRQAARWPNYKCIGDYHSGAYECDFVSPYTKTAGNVNAEIMVMLQDWASDGFLKGPFHESSAKLGHSPTLPTNRTLIRLLKKTFGLALADVYGTNLFPFVKPGDMSGEISERDLVAAARQFALPQIRIIKPKLVVCLGLATFNALRRACDLSPYQVLSSANESPFIIGTAQVWCQAHTGARGQNNRNKSGLDRVSDDWLRMKASVEEKGNRAPQQSSGQHAIQASRSDSGRRVIKIASRTRPVSPKENKMNTFILNNKEERPHREIYDLDDKLKGFAIYDYDEKQARHAFNSDFKEIKAGDRALVFGKDLKVKLIFRVTGTKKQRAPDLPKEVFVIYGEYFDNLAEPIRYRDFISKNRLSNPNLDQDNNFRRGMLVAHMY